MVAQLKRFIFRLSERLGLMSRIGDSRWRRHRLLVVCYHGVSVADEHEWDPELYISSETLGRHLDLLKRHRCCVLPLGEAVHRLYAGTLPPRSIALTFDDGFLDFKTRAWPAVSARGFPATVYMPTERCESGLPVGHLFASYLLWKHRNRVLDARDIEGLERVYCLSVPIERRHAVADLFARMRRDAMTAEDEHCLVRQIAARVGADYDQAMRAGLLRVMTATDVADLSHRGVDFELHTHRHRAPGRADDFVDDVQLNRTILQELTGRIPRHLCYPDGTYRESYLEPLERIGIATGTTCDPGLAAAKSHRLLLPRLIDNEMTSDLKFEGWITGLASWLPRRTTMAHGIYPDNARSAAFVAELG